MIVSMMLLRGLFQKENLNSLPEQLRALEQEKKGEEKKEEEEEEEERSNVGW